MLDSRKAISLNITWKHIYIYIYAGLKESHLLEHNLKAYMYAGLKDFTPPPPEYFSLTPQYLKPSYAYGVAFWKVILYIRKNPTI